eukprot:g3764.t1
MVIPLPSIAVAAYPSPKAMGYRNIFFGLATAIALSSAVQMFMLLEIMHGFMTGLIAFCGYYCLRDQSVDVQCLMSWGIICIINGILEVVQFIDRCVHMPPGVHVFSAANGIDGNLVSAILMVGMVSMLTVSYLVYQVYQESSAGGDGGGGGSAYGSSGGAPLYGTLPTFQGEGSGQSSASFQPFQGKGNTLGA